MNATCYIAGVITKRVRLAVSHLQSLQNRPLNLSSMKMKRPNEPVQLIPMRLISVWQARIEELEIYYESRRTG